MVVAKANLTSTFPRRLRDGLSAPTFLVADCDYVTKWRPRCGRSASTKAERNGSAAPERSVLRGKFEKASFFAHQHQNEEDDRRRDRALAWLSLLLCFGWPSSHSKKARSRAGNLGSRLGWGNPAEARGVGDIETLSRNPIVMRPFCLVRLVVGSF